VLQLFRTNQIFASILGFSFVFIWHSSIYFNVPEWEPSQSGIFMQEINFYVGHSSIAARLIVLLLLAIQYGLAINLLNSYRLADYTTVFPGIFLILFSCFSPYFLFLSSIHFVNTFFIIILFILFSTYNQPKIADSLFNSGLIAGISFLFFPPTFYILPIIFIGLSILRSYSFKERMSVLLGFIIPSFWAGLYYFWQDKFDLFYKYQFTNLFGYPQFSIQNLSYVTILMYGIFIVLSFFLILSYDKIGYRRIIQSRKRINLIYWSLGIITLVLFFLPQQGQEVYLLLSLPLSLLTSLGFITMKPKLADIFYFILILGLLVSHYLGLFL
jgi:hypothetical protein